MSLHSTLGPRSKRISEPFCKGLFRLQLDIRFEKRMQDRKEENDYHRD